MGALLDALIKLKIFAVETRDFTAMLVRAQSASAESEPLKSAARVTLGARVPADVAAQFREAAKQLGVTMSQLLSRIIADYIVTA
jgi:hypothetical protein